MTTQPNENPEPAPRETPQEAAQAGPSDDRYGRNETARNPNLDPDPEQTRDPDLSSDPAQNPGMRSAADLEPGQTPPESNSATATPPAPAPSSPPNGKLILGIVGAVIALLVILVFVGYIAGLLG